MAGEAEWVAGEAASVNGKSEKLKIVNFKLEIGKLLWVASSDIAAGRLTVY